MRFGMFARFRRPHYGVAAVVWMAWIFYLSHQASLGLPGLIAHQDKFMHFMAFGILGMFCAGAADSGRFRAPQFWLAVGVAAVYGILDEYHQSFVPGRDASIGDWLADLAGAVAGAGFYRWLRARGRLAE